MDLESRGIVLFVWQKKALISFAITVKLICAFVFAYADCWFSNAAAQIFLVIWPFILLALLVFLAYHKIIGIWTCKIVAVIMLKLGPGLIVTLNAPTKFVKYFTLINLTV